MKVDHYCFGKIIINGKTYASDVIIYPDSVDSSWWRKEGHYLRPVDLDKALGTKPDLLIIGTGFSGLMVVPEETVLFIISKGIKVLVERTEQATELFNSLSEDGNVVAAFHLTC
ncbi:MAG TPA: MTH938/NDUFAF3 family protein [Thermodesulfovibrionales bacterium]|nr:MTH938/NDUFAF3 family protein [Thermodesulfovibrionales bacterium]